MQTRHESSANDANERRPGIGVALRMDSAVARGFSKLTGWVQRYHRHRVENIERIGKLLDQGRRMVVVGNHALSAVDPILFSHEVFKRYGVVPRFIGHEALWFRTPGLRELSREFGVIPSRSPAAANHALEKHGFLMLFPGSGTEAALRDYRRESYRLKWENRLGFLRLALESNAEVLFVAGVGNEELYYQTRFVIPPIWTRRLDISGGDRYAGARLPLSLGPMALPAQLTHVVFGPLELGDRDKALTDDNALRVLHQRVWMQCQEFLDQAVHGCRSEADGIDRTVRRIEGLLRGFGL